VRRCGVLLRSDRFGEFIEGSRHTSTHMACFDAEFTVAASKVLDERMTADHDRRSPVRSKTSHRPKPRFESTVIALDPVARVLGRVMEDIGEQVLDDVQQRRSQIRGEPLLEIRGGPTSSRRTRWRL